MKNLIYLFAILTIITFSCKEKSSKSIAINSNMSEEFDYSIETVVEGLEIPWGMVFLPDNSMLITEKKGELIHFKNGKKNQVEGLPEIHVYGQGGLLDIELDPDYDKNGWI